MNIRRIGSSLIVFAAIFSLGTISAEAVKVSLSGDISAEYRANVGGDTPQPGAAMSIYEWPDQNLTNQTFRMTHIHPMLNIDVSDKTQAALMVCLSDRHMPMVWEANVAYSPYAGGDDFGGNPLTITAGRFFKPLGAYNLNSVMDGNLKTVSRPLAYTDHTDENMELHGGPRPIYMSPHYDTGLMLSGSKWVNNSQDQLWYGVYLVNGMYHNAVTFDPSTGGTEAASRVEMTWETDHVQPSDNNLNKEIGGRVAYSYGNAFTVGASYLTGKFDPESKLTNSIQIVDLHIPVGAGNFRAEYATNPTEWINGNSSTVDNIYSTGTKREYTKTGWYAQFDYPLTKKLEAAAMYSHLSGSRTEDLGTYTVNDMSRLALALGYSPEAALKITTEYQLTKYGTYNATASNVTNYGSKVDDLSRVLIKASLMF